MIDVTDFDKVEVRVGTVVEVKENRKARHPAYAVTIDFGPEIGLKKSSAQITTLYTPEELQSCAHPAELPPTKGTFVGIYPKVRGLGGHSCGPLPLDRDTLDDETYELSVLIK